MRRTIRFSTSTVYKRRPMSDDQTQRPDPGPSAASFPPIAPPPGFEPDPAPTVEEAKATAPVRPRGPARRPSLVQLLVATNMLLGVIVVLLALMVFAPTIAPLKLGATRSAIEAREDSEIEAVASRFARNFLSIDYRTLDADFARIQKDTTGKLRGDLSRILDLIRAPYRNTKSTSTGDVADARVLSRNDDTASVGVVVELTVTNEKRREAQKVTRSMELTLVRTPSGWKVSDARNLPTPSAPES